MKDIVKSKTFNYPIQRLIGIISMTAKMWAHTGKREK